MQTLSKSAGRVLVSSALAATCVAFAGCSSADEEQPAAPANRSATNVAPVDDGAGTANMNTDTSTALVVYVNGDEVAFVDQSTGALYIPTLPDDGVFNLEGQEIDDDQLAVGNIVSVTGNGMMLESYPAQYPGISKVQVIEQGDPAEADKYAQELETVFAGPDAGTVATGVAEYSTSLGEVALPLTAYEYELATGDPAAKLDGSYHAADGTLNPDVTDARISEETQVAVTFSADVTNVEVERVAVTQNEQGGWTVGQDPVDEKIGASVTSAKTAEFAMVPGYVYEVDVEFAGGSEASYAFVAVN